MSSVLEAILTNTQAELLAVPGTLAAKAVPITEMFRATSDDDVFLAETPDQYPGHVISLNDDEVEVVEVRQLAGTASMIMRAPLYIASLVYTDGTVSGQPQRDAWAFSEATLRRLALFAPIGPDVMPGVTSFVLEPEAFEPILADANTYGILQLYWAKYQIRVTAA